METIKTILERQALTVSFEVFPPKPHLPLEPVVRTLESLADLKPDFISVTYGADGGTRERTAALASGVERLGIPSLAHLTCVGNGPQEITARIRELKSRGIRNVLALRGDLPEGAAVIPGFAHASDLVPCLKDAGFCVGAACYPEGHPESRNREADLENLKIKVDAGVDFLTTQMVFDNDMLYSFLYRARSVGIDVPVLAGIMPVTNAAQIKRMAALSNAYVPRKLLMMIDRFGGHKEAMLQAGISYAVDQIIDLISNGIRGIHIYTMNRADITGAIVGAMDSIRAAVNKRNDAQKSSRNSGT
jgi:methylenetetrahydrofolate reductase (NADPH)